MTALRENLGVTDDDQPRITWRRVALEDEILSILVTSPEVGERIDTAYRRKELELIGLFARLSVLDSRELHRRISLSLADDPLAMQFTRLIMERRERLMSFLADARRREALRRAG